MDFYIEQCQPSIVHHPESDRFMAPSTRTLAICVGIVSLVVFLLSRIELLHLNLVITEMDYVGPPC